MSATTALSRAEQEYYQELAESWVQQILDERTPHSLDEWENHESHAVKRGRFTACPILLYTEDDDEQAGDGDGDGEQSWGAVIDGEQTDELDEGDVVELQIVTRSGKTWPSVHSIFHIVDDVAFAEPLK